jgi:hypothetical protein
LDRILGYGHLAAIRDLRAGGGKQIANLMQTTSKRSIGVRGDHKMAFARSHAVLSGSRVVGDERCQRSVCALDETGEAAIADLRRALTNILEQVQHCVW